MIHDHHACHLKGVLVDRGGLEIMKWLRIPVKSVLHLMQRSFRNRSISYTFPNFKNSNLEDRLYISMLVFTDFVMGDFCCIVHCNERTSLSFILLLYWFNISYEREEPNLCSTFCLNLDSRLFVSFTYCVFLYVPSLEPCRIRRLSHLLSWFEFSNSLLNEANPLKA